MDKLLRHFKIIGSLVRIASYDEIALDMPDPCFFCPQDSLPYLLDSYLFTDPIKYLLTS